MLRTILFLVRRMSLSPRRSRRLSLCVFLLALYTGILFFFTFRTWKDQRAALYDTLEGYSVRIPDFTDRNEVTDEVEYLLSEVGQDKVAQFNDVVDDDPKHINRILGLSGSEEEGSSDDENGGGLAGEDEVQDTVEDPEAVQESRYAFATLLAENVEMTEGGLNLTDYDLNTDEYFLAARVLTWQLLRSPRTRSREGIPFLILVTEDISDDKRDVLRKEGATIVEVDKTSMPDWMDPIFSRWRDQLAKLHVFEQTDYDKICFLDLDFLLTAPLDGVFDDPAVQWQDSLQNTDQVKEDEVKIPDRYLFAAHADPWGPSEVWPPEKGDYFNAGFFVIGPSNEAYDYYLSLLNFPDRFGSAYVEQDMLNYAHRLDGNMPWTSFADTWNALHPGLHHMEHGVRSFHTKFWRGSYTMREAKKAAMIEAAEDRKAKGLGADWEIVEEEQNDAVQEILQNDSKVTVTDVNEGTESTESHDLESIDVEKAQSMETARENVDDGQGKPGKKKKSANKKSKKKTATGKKDEAAKSTPAEEAWSTDKNDEKNLGEAAATIKPSKKHSKRDVGNSEQNTPNMQPSEVVDSATAEAAAAELLIAAAAAAALGGLDQAGSSNLQSQSQAAGDSSDLVGATSRDASSSSFDGIIPDLHTSASITDSANEDAVLLTPVQQEDSSDSETPLEPQNQNCNCEEKKEYHQVEDGPYWKLFRDLEPVQDEGSDVDPALRELWLQHRWEMEGFYHGMEEALLKVTNVGLDRWGDS